MCLSKVLKKLPAYSPFLYSASFTFTAILSRAVEQHQFAAKTSYNTSEHRDRTRMGFQWKVDV